MIRTGNELIAELKQAFPWLATDNDEPVSGADVVDSLIELYQSLIPVIWIVRYTHRHGTDLQAFSTQKAAELMAQQMAEDNMDEMGSAYTEPDWTIWGEQTNDAEFIEVSDVLVDP